MRPEPGRLGTSAQRWLARLSFALAGLAVVIVVVFAGLKSLAMLAVGVAAAVVTLAAEDLAAASYLYEKATRLGAGTTADF